MVETNAKHNIVTAELEQVKKIESEIATTDSDVLQKRLEQGTLLASLKNHTQGIEVWEKWVPANLGFSRTNADNYINIAKWYVAHSTTAGPTRKRIWRRSSRPESGVNIAMMGIRASMLSMNC
jgi:hypothetical protein